MGLKVRTYSVIIAVCLGAHAHAQVSGTIESYFQSDRLSHGFNHVMSWGELNVRFNSTLKATLSETSLPTRRLLDEASITYDCGPAMVRAGRFRTSFGFSSWSDVFYQGINHLPMVMLQPLSHGLKLLRDDDGVEFTASLSGVELQAALLDTRPSNFQVGPKEFRAVTVRAQGVVNGAIVGLDSLSGFNGEGSIVGADLRWTSPRFVVRGEFMKGIGAGTTASGYFANVAYRVPRIPRTQVIAQMEGLFRRGVDDYFLHTVGARFIPLPNLTLIGNYAWGNGNAPGFVAFSGTTGWSMRALFQIHF